MTPTITARQAREAYLGAEVYKVFKQGPFRGVVKKVETNLEDKKGVRWPVLFKITYEDGDEEHITLDELKTILVDKQGAQDRLDKEAALEAADDAAAAAAAAAGGDSNDENEAGARLAPQPAKKRRTAGVLGERGNLAPADERRSRREAKRRHDDDFVYEQPNAKRASAAAAPARFGIRAPAAHAALDANPASESQEAAPLGEGGMRLEGLAGHLKRIEVVDFMCHENFAMDFGQHVTFVSGTNGSGKSAVLQALQCCLGVKASDTGRASSFKKLIRTGSDEAIIRVTIANRPYKGFDAFRHGVFGDTITVERRIKAAGTSSYALKDAAGRVHGRKRDDLDAMLQTLGLNAANPVCVMTQDTARNFLAGSSTKSDQEKFQLYMEATSLEQIAYCLELSRAQIRRMREDVVAIREEYDTMTERHAELKKGMDALQGIAAWRAEAEQLEQVLTWAVVEEHSAGAQRLVAALEGEVPQRLADTAGRLEELQREHAALQEAVDSKGTFLNSYKDRANALSAEFEGAKVQAREAHRAVRSAVAKMKQLQQRLEEEQERKETMEQAAAEVQGDMVAATQAAVSAYQQELQAAREAEEACRHEVMGFDAALQDAAAAAKAAWDRHEAIRSSCYATSQQMSRVQQEIAGLKDAGRSALARFGGRPMVELAQEVTRAKGRFSRPPIGPIGHHLALQDSRFALAVEAAMGTQLEAWICHSMDDSRLLRSMIQRCFAGQNFKPSVYVSNFDTPQHSIPLGQQPPQQLTTLYRLLSVADRRLAAPIMNTLVDQAHIERIAVGSGQQECKQAAWDTPHVMACYGVDGSKFYRRGSTQTMIPSPHWLARRPGRLGASTAQQTAELEREVARLQGELQGLEQQVHAAAAEHEAANAAEREARLALRDLKRKQWGTEHALTQLTQQPPPELEAATQADGAEGQQAEILQCMQVIIDLEQQLRDRQADLEAAQAAEAAARAAHDEKQADMKRLADDNQQFLDSFQAETERAAEAEAELRELSDYVEQLQASAAQLQAQAAQAQDELAELEAQAALICTREQGTEARAAVEARLRGKGASEEEVAQLLTPEMLERKIAQLDKKVREHERAAGGSLDDLQVQFAASQARMGREGRRCCEAIAMFELVEDAYKLRRRKLQELDHLVEATVNARFRAYMWKKGHTGMIKLDRKARSLSLKVTVNSQPGGGGGGGGAAVKDLKQLSGGERSYTTVAFTLALGGQTEMPFRAMDEFDVFMDAVNRRVAMQNLLSFAKENPELQFVFLTPQDISAVDDAREACQRAGQAIPGGFVRIVAMRPARANATRA